MVTLWGEAGAGARGALPYPVLPYEQVLQQGAALLERGGFELVRCARRAAGACCVPSARRLATGAACPGVARLLLARR